MGYRIVFIHHLDQGHLQICLAIGKSLLFRNPNNDIFFITDEENHKRIKDCCSKFNTLIYERIENEKIQNGRLNNLDSCFMKNEERFKQNIKNSANIIKKWKPVQHIIIQMIEQVKPDLILVENLCTLPFIMNYKWAMLISTNPLLIADQTNYPVICSGVSEKSDKYTNIWTEYIKDFKNQLNEWFNECGQILNPSLSFIQPSPFFNVFLYPKMLNYFEPEDLDGRWLQLSSTIISDEVNEFIKNQGWSCQHAVGKEILSDEFLQKPGLLIFFSLGTIISQNIKIVQKLISIFAECPHKFIVSKGKLANRFELPSNCVGANNINQLEILQICDLFITHGGNNSFTESCYFGKPMIIIPGYADQHDNACRLETFQLGKRIYLRDISKETLCSAIDFVANNDIIKKKMKKLSEQMKSDDSMNELCDLILEMCSKNLY